MIKQTEGTTQTVKRVTGSYLYWVGVVGVISVTGWLGFTQIKAKVTPPPPPSQGISQDYIYEQQQMIIRNLEVIQKKLEAGAVK